MELEMKKKRGRPKTNGVRPGWVLLREHIALNAYDEARTAGEKHETSLGMMIEAVHRWNPEMPMSLTEAKRILARWRGKRQSTIIGRGERILEGEEAALYLERSYDLQVRYAELKGLPRPPRPTATTVRVSSFGIGRVPRYARSNSRRAGDRS